MPASSVQVLKQCGGAGPSQCETPNVAGERIWFAGDSMADVARDRGDGHGEKRQSEMGRQRRSCWPSEVHLQVVRCVSCMSTTNSLHAPLFATKPCRCNPARVSRLFGQSGTIHAAF